MRVKVLVDCYSMDLSCKFKAGQTIDLPKERAERAIKLGYAEKIEPKAAKPTTVKNIETAMLDKGIEK